MGKFELVLDIVEVFLGNEDKWGDDVVVVVFPRHILLLQRSDDDGKGSCWDEASPLGDFDNIFEDFGHPLNSTEHRSKGTGKPSGSNSPEP